MSPSRLRKRIIRSLKVSWREQPTRQDIAALQDNIRRVGLVVQLRWWLVGALAAYSVVAGAIYLRVIPVAELAGLMTIPAIALGLVVLYNAFFQATYRRFGNLALFNNLQLGLDALVVTVLVYYSGGAASWFWSMYSLFILEAAFIMTKRTHVWLLAGWCALLLGSVEFAEATNLLPHQVVPFASVTVAHTLAFVGVRYLWQIAVLAGTAWVATTGISHIQRSSTAPCESLLDSATGLYARGYFQRALTAELGRALRDKRRLHVVLLDIDDFAEFNRRFGLDRGDELLSELAAAITLVVSTYGDVLTSTNVAARWGGEEFAVLLVEDHSAGGGEPSTEAALRLAEELRVTAGEVRVQDAGVTVSVGLASFPDHGSTAEEILTAADEALVRAVEAGGDRVCVAEAHGDEGEADDDGQADDAGDA